jgi:hypothetical protein
VGRGRRADWASKGGTRTGFLLRDSFKNRRRIGNIQLTRYFFILGRLEWCDAGPGQIDILGVVHVVPSRSWKRRLSGHVCSLGRLTSKVNTWIITLIVKRCRHRRPHWGISIRPREGIVNDLTGLETSWMVFRAVVLAVVVALLVRISMLRAHRRNRGCIIDMPLNHGGGSGIETAMSAAGRARFILLKHDRLASEHIRIEI